MAITTAISNLFSSVYEFIASIFGAIYAVIHGVISTIASLISTVVLMIGNALSSIGSVASAAVGFIAGNVVILSIGAVAAFVFVKYTAQGQRVAAKKTR